MTMTMMMMSETEYGAHLAPEHAIERIVDAERGRELSVPQELDDEHD